MRFRCYNCPDPRPECFGRFREFEADRPLCPRCGGGEAAVQALVDVHFIVADPKGPIRGKLGRYRVACEPKREVLARHKLDRYAATGEPRAVTCRSCMGTRDYREMLEVAAFKDELLQVREEMEADYPDMVQKVSVIDLGKK